MPTSFRPGCDIDQSFWQLVDTLVNLQVIGFFVRRYGIAYVIVSQRNLSLERVEM